MTAIIVTIAVGGVVITPSAFNDRVTLDGAALAATTMAATVADAGQFITTVVCRDGESVVIAAPKTRDVNRSLWLRFLTRSMNKLQLQAAKAAQ